MLDNMCFKVGYKVICIDDTNTRMLEKNMKYTIESIEDSKCCKNKYLLFKELSGSKNIDLVQIDLCWILKKQENKR